MPKLDNLRLMKKVRLPKRRRPKRKRNLKDQLLTFLKHLHARFAQHQNFPPVHHHQNYLRVLKPDSSRLMKKDIQQMEMSQKTKQMSQVLFLLLHHARLVLLQNYQWHQQLTSYQQELKQVNLRLMLLLHFLQNQRRRRRPKRELLHLLHLRQFFHQSQNLFLSRRKK